MNQGSDRKQGLRALAALVPGATRAARAKRSSTEAALLLDWSEIVGREIAARSRPGRLIFSPPGSRREGRLGVAVDPAFALDLQHLAPLVIERINGYFGYRAVAELKLRQEPIRRQDRPLPPRPQPLSGATRAALDQRLQGIEDPELRGALQRLAEAVASRKAGPG
jgi:hypothetical protein